MADNNELTFSLDSKDGTLTAKDAKGVEVRYVKESDLLAVKGSKENAVRDAETAKTQAIAEANSKVDAALSRALQAEARVSSLEEQIAQSGGSAAELVKAKADLEAAKKSSEALGNKHLELKRNVIVATYGVPLATVATKNLAALDLYEEALKAVMGDKRLGNFAIGSGGGGGTGALQGKSPIDLARDAYASSNK